MNDTPKFPVITICGPTEHKDHIAKAAEEYTKNGWLVLYPACYNRDEIENDSSLKRQLVNMHKQMVDMSSAVLVVAEKSRFGKSTSEIIEYAKQRGKGVIYQSIE